MLKPYNKKYNLSYAFGVTTTIELLEQKPEEVVTVVTNPKGSKNTGIDKILGICSKHNIPVESNKRLVEKLSQSENTYAMAVFKKYESGLKPKNDHVVLVNPSDMGNLGTICRTMAGFDFTNLAIIKPAVDIFDPKVIRASMGAIFYLNIEYFESFSLYQKEYAHNTYTFMSDGETLLDNAVFKTPYSLVFGNEGEGLGAEYKNLGGSIKIPQSGKVDSFNLSVVVGIALYGVKINPHSFH